MAFPFRSKPLMSFITSNYLLPVFRIKLSKLRNKFII